VTFPYISHGPLIRHLSVHSPISQYLPLVFLYIIPISCISHKSPISIFHESLNISIHNYHPKSPSISTLFLPDLLVPTLRVSILDLRSIPRIFCISQGYPHTSRSGTLFISFESCIYNGFSCIFQSGSSCIFHGSSVTSSISPQSCCATVGFLVSPMCLPVKYLPVFLFVFLKSFCILKLSLCTSYFASPCIFHSGSLCISPGSAYISCGFPSISHPTSFPGSSIPFLSVLSALFHTPPTLTFPYISHRPLIPHFSVYSRICISPWCSCISLRSPVSLMSLPTSPISIFHESLNISISYFFIIIIPNLPPFLQDLPVSGSPTTLRVSALDVRSMEKIFSVSNPSS
jgi:hypothetical protein